MSLESILGIVASIATISSFIAAYYQFSQWRKQQRYGIELSTLLDIEDQFELLIYSQTNIKVAMLERNKATKNAKSSQERENVENWLQGDFSISLKKALAEHAEIAKSYSLLAFRGKRLKLWQEIPQELDAAHINKKFNTLIEDNSPPEETAIAISKIKEAAYDKFKKIRAKYV